MLTQYDIVLKDTEVINCSGYGWLKSALSSIRYDDIYKIYKNVSKNNSVELPLERFEKYAKKD